MKLRALALAMFSLLFSACASFDTHLPEGKAGKVRYVRTGKFSSTTIEAEGYERTATHVTAAHWSVKHSNAWVPNVEIEATDYQRALPAGDKR